MPNVEICTKSLTTSRARYTQQLELMSALKPTLETYTRGTLDGWMKRHIEKNLAGARVVIGDHGHTTFWKEGMEWNDHVSIWGKDYEELKKNVSSRVEGLTESIQEVDALLPQLETLAAEWLAAAQTIDRITSIKGMGNLTGEFKHLR